MVFLILLFVFAFPLIAGDTEVLRLLIPKAAGPTPIQLLKNAPRETSATSTVFINGVPYDKQIQSGSIGQTSISDGRWVKNAGESASPIVIVLDFHHVWGERRECLIAELLPALAHPRFKDRIQVYILGASGQEATEIRSRRKTFALLDLAQVDVAQVDAKCRMPGFNIDPDVSKWKQFLQKLGYNVEHLPAKWANFSFAKLGTMSLMAAMEQSRTWQETLSRDPHAYRPTRIFWLAEDFTAWLGPPGGCDSGVSLEGVVVTLGGECDGAEVDRNLMYHLIYPLTLDGGVFTPIVMQHPTIDNTTGNMRRKSLKAAAEVAEFTGTKAYIAKSWGDRTLLRAIEESENWPIFELTSPIKGMTALTNKPQTVNLLSSTGDRWERRMSLKPGQMFKQAAPVFYGSGVASGFINSWPSAWPTLPLFSAATRNGPLPALAGSITRGPSDLAIAAASQRPADPFEAVPESRVTLSSKGSSVDLVLHRRLDLKLTPGCQLITDPVLSNSTSHLPSTLTVSNIDGEPNLDYRLINLRSRFTAVELVLRQNSGILQPIPVTRDELRNGVCIGIPQKAEEVQVMVIDPMFAAGGSLKLLNSDRKDTSVSPAKPYRSGVSNQKELLRRRH
jgi:hypothetical protein